MWAVHEATSFKQFILPYGLIPYSPITPLVCVWAPKQGNWKGDFSTCSNKHRNCKSCVKRRVILWFLTLNESSWFRSKTLWFNERQVIAFWCKCQFYKYFLLGTWHKFLFRNFAQVLFTRLIIVWNLVDASFFFLQNSYFMQKKNVHIIHAI